MSENDRGRAEGLIRAAERDLRRKLSRGEMRDLLADRTRWSFPKIRAVVVDLFPERVDDGAAVPDAAEVERGRA